MDSIGRIAVGADGEFGIDESPVAFFRELDAGTGSCYVRDAAGSLIEFVMRGSTER